MTPSSSGAEVQRLEAPSPRAVTINERSLNTPDTQIRELPSEEMDFRLKPLHFAEPPERVGPVLDERLLVRQPEEEGKLMRFACGLNIPA